MIKPPKAIARQVWLLQGWLHAAAFRRSAIHCAISNDQATEAYRPTKSGSYKAGCMQQVFVGAQFIERSAVIKPPKAIARQVGLLQG